jgi:hypothetical protein
MEHAHAILFIQDKQLEGVDLPGLTGDRRRKSE